MPAEEFKVRARTTSSVAGGCLRVAVENKGHVAVKQNQQSLKTGVIALLEVPTARVRAGHVLVCTSRTRLSAGTERMLIAFDKAI